MAAGTVIKHKRKAGEFTSGQLQAGEIGVNTAADQLEFSTDGSDVVQLEIVTNVAVKVYRAYLTQSGTDAPEPIVVENSIGTIVWSYIGTGHYRATLSEAFPANKTFTFCDKVIYDATSLEDPRAFKVVQSSTSVITLYAGTSATPADDILVAYEFTILVYP